MNKSCGNRLANEIFTKGKSKAFVYFDFEKYHQTLWNLFQKVNIQNAKPRKMC